MGILFPRLNVLAAVLVVAVQPWWEAGWRRQWLAASCLSAGGAFLGTAGLPSTAAPMAFLILRRALQLTRIS